MQGQYTIFSYKPIKKRHPCEYSFNRYIGQLVRDNHGTHRIAEIYDFYTIYDDGTVGTPHDMDPVDEKEYAEMLDVEIEYEEHRLKSNQEMNRNMAKSNLEILRKLKGQCNGN